jgi:zinc protease
MNIEHPTLNVEHRMMKWKGEMKTMFRIRFYLPVVVILLFCVCPGIMAKPIGEAKDASISLGADIDIPYSRFVLNNGLTLIVHEDHKAPIVAVNIWYHVGSKNEKTGRTGFAHLFEHLMFNGTEDYNDDYFQPMERVGATDMNGTTSEDRTNYFENVPASALDLALWMESDRMGHLKGAIDQAKLDEQRGVVQNEKRQGENQPYGMADELMTSAIYPAGHPYSWTVIGSMTDLNAASIDDVQEWFKTYYGASNAVVVLAGDIDAQTAKTKVEKYFGDIPSGPPIAKFTSWPAKREENRRQIYYDRVPQARIYKEWNVAGWGAEDAASLELLTGVLSSGKSSRLYKRLVYDEQIATSVDVYYDDKEIGGQFMIIATVKSGVDPAVVEKAVDEELARLVKDGVKDEELKRVKTEDIASFIRGVERIGGFGGKSDILAQNEVYAGDPGYYKVTLAHIRTATPQALQEAAAKWLTSGEYVLEILPFPDYSVSKSGADRTRLPAVESTPDSRFPKIERATLTNGIKLVVAEWHSVPIVQFALLFDAGFSTDQQSSPGTAKLAMNMLDEGTLSRSSLEISDELSLLGARLGSGSNLDQSVVSLSALKENLGKSLNLLADVLINPSFPQKEFERLKKEQLAAIDRENAQPKTMALRVFPILLYGKDHAYGMPFTGSGYKDTVSKLTREDLIAFKEKWLMPNNATMVVVGDITLKEIKPKLEKIFKTWTGTSESTKIIATVASPAKSKFYLIDRPGASQSLIIAGQTAPPKSDPKNIALEMMNQVLGDSFTSRINMNLREDKHWSYGAGSSIVDTRGARPFMVQTSVQSDKTKDAVVEILKEIKGILGEKPITQDEYLKVRENMVLTLPGNWETMSAIQGSILEIVRFGLPDNYFETYPQTIKNQNLADLSDAAKTMLKPDNMIWVIVGDVAKIEPGLKELGLGEIEKIDLK